MTATALPGARPEHRIGLRARRRIWWTLSAAILVVGALMVITPFVFMLATSFNGDAWYAIPFPPEVVPTNPTVRAYASAAQYVDVFRLYGNTMLVAGVEIIFSLVSATLTAYALSFIRPRGSSLILGIILATMIIPAEAIIIPNFLTFTDLGLTDGYWPLWLPALSYPFGTFLIKQYFDGLPREYRDAAKVDGAGELRIAAQIYLPLSKPIIATTAILLYLSAWNSFLWPFLILNSPDKFTIQLGLSAFSTSFGGDQYAMPALIMAGTVISVLPVLVVYLLLQRHIVASVAAHGVKG